MALRSSKGAEWRRVYEYSVSYGRHKGRINRVEKVRKVKVIHDRTGNTLTVWFGEPSDEYICSETGEEVVLIRDKNLKVIGFELLSFLPPGDQSGFSGEVEILAKTFDPPI
jgi:hypothetical protein